MLTGLYARWTGQKPDPERMAYRLEDIRLAMLDMLGEEGARQHPQVARRIRFGGDAQALWYARADLMAALANASGERSARERTESLSVLFDGMLPKGLMSRPTTLRS
ncbi:hypothetical protein FVQ98_08910 [Ottowia sp. GY511]|uniref:Uncharacterized protein n=1 Tax=Ottowia flava TaxID=2675430 RepID=A0ABW4KNR4_9BURK|nr:hypothetical protein [Ottowia sp. GY511]TXK29627.1 hypothetical protein FVQ98_08910 [Ottowia sp. GY511]